MRCGKCLFILALLPCFVMRAEPPREAMDLYERSMFDGARVVFDSSDDPLSKAYSVLCAIRGRFPGYEARLREYEKHNPKSVLYDEMHYRLGHNLFEDRQYEKAGEQYALVKENRISRNEIPTLLFEKAWCALDAKAYPEAETLFKKVRSMGVGRYYYPSCFYLGEIAYRSGDFDSAGKYFSECTSDAELGSLSRFYVLECRFVSKDYDYIIANAGKEIPGSPSERKARLSRMLSEAYLIKGDKENARLYYEQENLVRSSSKTRSDYFHAGSVLFNTGDYAAAAMAFSEMKDRTDSIGQIANYQLGYCYVKQGNKVAALDAFNAAAKYSYNPEIFEDAAFNYAKLAFDINNDDSGFKFYLKYFPSSGKEEQIYGYMALACLVNRDYGGAIEHYSKIEELSQIQKNNFVKANFFRGRQLMDAGAWSDAEPYLHAALFHYPNSDRFNQLARFCLAETLYMEGKYDQARNYYTELYNIDALSGTGQNEVLPYNIAYCHYEKSDFVQAARWFDKYIAAGRGSLLSDARERRSDCDFYRAKYKEALAGYSRLRKENARLTSLYPVFREGQCYGFLQNLPQKISVLSDVGKYSPDVPYYSETLYELGRAYLDASEYAMASAAFSRLRADAADSSFVVKSLIGQGMARRNARQYDEALVSYKEVVSLVPGSESAKDALSAIEAIYQEKNQPQKYLEWLEKERPEAVGMTADKKRSLKFDAAQRLYLSGSYGEAVSLLEGFVSEYADAPETPQVWLYLADAYKLSGEKEKSCAAYEKAAGTLPVDSSFYESAIMGSAAANYSLERYAEAGKYYLKAVEVCKIESNRKIAAEGLMMSAYKSADYETAISAASSLESDSASLIKGKSLLATGRREEALRLFRNLASRPSTDEGAESECLLIQDCLDRGDHENLEKRVFAFASSCGSQNYYLAKAYMMLGDSFAARGNAAQAKATYESIIGGYTGEDDIRENVLMRLNKLENAGK